MKKRGFRSTKMSPEERGLINKEVSLLEKEGYEIAYVRRNLENGALVLSATRDGYQDVYTKEI